MKYGAALCCLYFLSIVLFSCSNNINDVDIIEGQMIHFDQPERISNNRLFFYEKGDERLIIQAVRNKQQIIINNLKSKKSTKWVINSKFDWNTLYAMSPDSVLLINRKNGKIQLIDSTSKVLNYWELPLIIDSVKYSLKLQLQSDLLFINDYLVASVLGTKGDDYIYNYNIDYIYNLKKRKFVKLIMKFPKIYSIENNWASLGVNFTKTLYGDEIFYNFPMYGNIVKYNLQTEQQDIINIKPSQYLKDFPPTPLAKDWNTLGNDYHYTYWIDKPCNLELIYDKYRNIFYRLICHEQPLRDAKNNLNNEFTRTWSIMIFDSDLKLIKEKFFNGMKYLPRYTFVYKNGLIILTDDRFNLPDKGVNYQTFKIEIKK